jgi:uncharacterized delta-60 repeat protein
MSAGSLDKTFNSPNGFLTNIFSGTSAVGTCVSINTDGTIIVSAQYTNATESQLLLAKYKVNGTLDTNTFGSGAGFITKSLLAGYATICGKNTIDNDGNILVCGWLEVDNSGVKNMYVAKFLPDGSLDTNTFGSGAGFVTKTFYTGKDTLATYIKLDNNNKIVVCGTTFDNDDIQQIFVARYNSDGSPDISFGSSNGYFIIPLVTAGTGMVTTNFIFDNNNILVIGISDPSNQKLYLGRLLPDGKYDGSFGGGKGYITTNFGTLGSLGYSLVVDSGKYLVLAGVVNSDLGDATLILSRFLSNGDLDDSFGKDGYVTIKKDCAGDTDFYKINYDLNGNLMICGTIITNTVIQRTIMLTLWTKNGVLDTSFGTDGFVYSNISGISGQNAFTDFVIDSNNNIVVIGTVFDSGIPSLLLARYIGEPITTTTTTEPICLPAGTPILTDQGLVAIEKIDTKKHTINHKRIVAITKTITPEKHLVCFEANSMGINCPTQRTLMTPGHEVLYKGKLVQSKHFVGRLEGVHTVPYNGKDVLYNVLQEQHGLMRVNNMVLETLHPENKVAKTLLEKL